MMNNGRTSLHTVHFQPPSTCTSSAWLAISYTLYPILLTAWAQRPLLSKSCHAPTYISNERSFAIATWLTGIRSPLPVVTAHAYCFNVMCHIIVPIPHLATFLTSLLSSIQAHRVTYSPKSILLCLCLYKTPRTSDGQAHITHPRTSCITMLLTVSLRYLINR